MKPHTDKEKLHLMRQQLATQDRVIAELRKKRISAVCRAKAFQKHLKDAKRKVTIVEGLLKGAHDCMNALDRLSDEAKRALAEESDRWQRAYGEVRADFVAETAAHAETARAMDAMRVDRDMWSDRFAHASNELGIARGEMQAEVTRGDRWQVYGLIVTCIAVGLGIALWVGV